jgi:hypothetical protein
MIGWKEAREGLPAMTESPEDKTGKRGRGRPRKPPVDPLLTLSLNPRGRPRKTPHKPLLRVVHGGSDAAQEDTQNAAQAQRKSKVRSATLPEYGVTVKQEAFCQAIMSGMTLSDAFRAAYVTDGMTQASIWGDAYKTSINPAVMARLETLRAEAEGRRRMLAASDAEKALKKIRELMDGASSDAVKLKAAEVLAKAAGVFEKDKGEDNPSTGKTAQEIEASILARLKRLGVQTGT